MTETNTLDELERSVTEKWATAAAERMPDLMKELGLPQLSAEWRDAITTALPTAAQLQFPREQWATYPAKRTVALLLCDRLLDGAGDLTDEQWTTVCFLMQFGGRTRLS